MEKQMLGHIFKYENDCLFKRRMRGIGEWICYKDTKPDKGHGYIMISLNHKCYRLHRLIYKFHNDEWDIDDTCRNNYIDHINQDKLDNRIENLRVVTHSQNRQNMTHINGKVIKGYSFNKRFNTWGAQWVVNNRRYAKSFATEEEAIAYRAEMVRIHYTHDPLKSSFLASS